MATAFKLSSHKIHYFYHFLSSIYLWIIIALVITSSYQREKEEKDHCLSSFDKIKLLISKAFPITSFFISIMANISCQCSTPC